MFFVKVFKRVSIYNKTCKGNFFLQVDYGEKMNYELKVMKICISYGEKYLMSDILRKYLFLEEIYWRKSVIQCVY